MTQGDIILDCPILTWSIEPVRLRGKGDHEALHSVRVAHAADVIVMTQACDLAQNPVDVVIVCPTLPLSSYRDDWEAARAARGEKITEKAWGSQCEALRKGFLWNMALINSGAAGGLTTEHRVVFFHEVNTIPRVFLQSLLQRRRQKRLQLVAPYREHLSQAFARYFMRVGLPAPVDKAWQ